MKQKLYFLQSLRGIAALIVCFFHGRMLVFNGNHIFGEGAFGVEIFFMISGFIMIHTTRKTLFSPGQESKLFLLKRLIRVVPLYYLATLAAIAVKHEWKYFGPDAGYLIKALLFLPTGNKIPLYVGWTLNYEVLFYLIFGICLLFGKYKTTALYIIYAFLLIIAPYFSSYIANNSLKEFFDFITNKIQINFIIGTALALVIPRLKPGKPVVLLVSVITVAAFVVLYKPFIQPQFLTTVILSAIITTGALITDFSNVTVKIPAPFIKLGDISYSLYLIHPITLLYWPGILTKLHLTSHIVTWPSFFIWFGISAGLSVISFNVFEKRVTAYLSHIFIKPAKSPDATIIKPAEKLA